MSGHRNRSSGMGRILRGSTPRSPCGEAARSWPIAAGSWTPSSRRAAVLAAGLLVLPFAASAQLPGRDPDWPCEQRLNPELAAAQMWRGPSPAGLPQGSTLAPALGALPDQLADPDQALDAVRDRVRTALQAVPAAQRPTQLTLLFEASLQRLNAERGRMIEGLRRFTRRQRDLSGRIIAETRQATGLEQDAAAGAKVADLRDAQAWDRRIYEERQRSVRALCDQPGQLERRAYALAQGLVGLLP